MRARICLRSSVLGFSSLVLLLVARHTRRPETKGTRKGMGRLDLRPHMPETTKLDPGLALVGLVPLFFLVRCV